MSKIGIIGDNDSIQCFKVIGFELRPVMDSREQALNALKELKELDCSIIFVIEKYYVMLLDEIQKYDNDYSVAIISLPGRSGSDGTGMKMINTAVEKAIGSNILEQ